VERTTEGKLSALAEMAQSNTAIQTGISSIQILNFSRLSFMGPYWASGIFESRSHQNRFAALF